MARKTIWKVALIALLILAISPVCMLIAPNESTVLMKLEKNEDELGNYTVSLAFDEADSICDAGVILGAQVNGFSGTEGANLVSAKEDENGNYSVSFSAPEDEAITIQPYAKHEGSDDASLYEPTTLGEASISDETRFLKTGSSLLPTSSFTEYNTSAKELPSLLETISFRLWGNEDCILINVTGSASFDDEVLFGQKTIFRTNGEKLPIVICGNGNATLDFTAEKIVSANDYTFDSLSMPIGKKDISFYAGCGNVVFSNVDFGAERYGAKAKFFGDNYTSAAYLGWNSKRLTANQNASKLLQSSITFGEGITYFPPEGHLSAIGFDEAEYLPAEKINVSVLPKNTTASFILDGASVTEISARAGLAPVADALLEMRSGNVISLIGNVDRTADSEKVDLKGSVRILVSGGKVAGAIKTMTDAVLDGGLLVEISQGDKPTIIASVKGATDSEILGESALTVTGGELNGVVEGSASAVATVNTISGGIFYSDFVAVSDGNTKRITNNLSDCEFHGTFYGGGSESVTVSEKAETSIVSGKYYGNVYPGNKKASAVDSLLTICCAKANSLIFDGTVGGRNLSKEAVEIVAVRDKRNILLGENARMHITYVYTSYLDRIPGLFDKDNPNPSVKDYQVFEPLTQWKDGVEHIRYYRPANIPDNQETTAREDIKFTSFVRAMGSKSNYTYQTIDLDTPFGENTQVSILKGKNPNGTLVQDISEYPTVPEDATIEDHGLTLDAGKLTQAQIDAIPIANASMTTDELRQISLDYFALQQSFSWTPAKTLYNYPTSNVSEGKHDSWMNKTLEVGKIYGSIPYQSTGTGNLYRWMEYYDENTGIMYLTDAILENGGFTVGDENTDVYHNKEYEDIKHPGLRAFFNQCSVASFWGWARVVNSANFAWTADMNVRNGFIPVGLYTYGYTDYTGTWQDMTTITRFGEGGTTNPGFYASASHAAIGRLTYYDTKHVISDYNKANTSKMGYSKAFYDIYAQMKPADCLVNSGHAMMVASVDPANQTVRVCEQIEGWGIAESKGYTMSGVPYIRQGQAYKQYTFSDLMGSNYLPFTFAEYQDPNKADDPNVIDDADYLKFYNETILPKTVNIKERYTYVMDKLTAEGKTLAGITGSAVEKTEMYVYVDENHNGKVDATEPAIDPSVTSLQYSQLRYMIISSNQTISDVFITVERPDGTVLRNKVIRPLSASMRVARFNHNSCVDDDMVYSTMADINTGKNIITIKVQLGTGELVTLVDHAKF